MLGVFFMFLFFILGACIGSFINVVVLRLQSSEHNFWTYRSYCYNCRRTLLWRDMIPIFSWFLLKGRCRYCHHRFSGRYALVEFSVAGLALFCAFFSQTPLEGFEIFFFCTVLLAIGLIDLDTWMIPLALPLLIACVGLGLGYWQDWEIFYARFIGMVVGLAFFAAFLVISTAILRWSGRLKPDESAMGWGDPILISAIGANLGWFWLSWVILLASIQGIIVYFLYSLKRMPQADDSWIPPQKSMPFGSFLALAAVEISLISMI